MDGASQRLSRDVIAELKRAASSGEITSRTKVSLTVGQWMAIFSPAVGLISAIVGFGCWASGEFHIARQEANEVRLENKAAIVDLTHAISKLESKWEITIRDTASEIKEQHHDQYEILEDTVADLRNRITNMEAGSTRWMKELEDDIAMIRSEIENIRGSKP